MLGWLVLSCAAASAAAQLVGSRVVDINEGPVRGYLDPDGSMFSYYDVPYATAPTGRDRFKAPLAPPRWTQPFEAVYRGIACRQPLISGLSKTMQDDCLVANILVPNTVSSNRSVAVYIHGGSFTGGSGITSELRNFVRNNDLIIVTFNYRLGPFGFLCLGTESVPGNAGFKDQAALLRWVNRNIASFGGNPFDVTVMGCSAGGISADLLTLSKMTNGLFQRAVPDSGCGFGALAMQYDPIANAQNYARRLNFRDINNINALEEFYLTVSHSRLLSEVVSTLITPDSGLSFTACIERDIGVEMFLEEDPAEIMRKGDFPAMPLLYGLAEAEGMIRLPNIFRFSSMMNNNFADFLPAELEFESDEQKESVARTVRQFYFGDRPVGFGTISGYIDFFTDVVFGYRTLKGLTLRLGAKPQPIYLYLYSFVHENTITIPVANIRAPVHCEQQVIMIDEDTSGKSAEYINMQNTMRSLWTNFMLTGKPVPDGSPLPAWPGANRNRSPYMDLGNVVQLKNNMFGARFDLWNSIYERHYRKPKRPNPH